MTMNSAPPKNLPDFIKYVIQAKDYIQREGDPLSSIAANQVLATPNGAPGDAGFRALVSNDIPNLDASKIGSGTLDTARIPNLATGQFITGSFSTARIPNLDASKFTAGTFSASRFDLLPASKFTTGVFDNARIDWDNPNSPTGNLTPTTGAFTDLTFNSMRGLITIDTNTGARVITNGVTVAYMSATETSIELPPATNYFTSLSGTTGLAGMLCVKVKTGGAIFPTILPASGDDIDGAGSLATASGRGYIFFAVLATRWRLFARFN